LRESEKRYRSILETAPHSITITCVKDGRFLQVNEAFCQMRGYSREETLGRTTFELNLYVNPKDRERLIKTLKEKGEVNGFEVQYQKRDGTAIDTLVSARPLEYENEDCLIAVVTDITELKQAEGALKKRLAYEKMLSDISTRAISIEDKDISRCLDECLEIMGKTSNVSRIYIFEYHHEPGTADNTFEWVSDGIAPQKENLQGLPMKGYPWWMEMMNNNKIISYQDIEDIPGGPEKKLLLSQSIKAILVVPLFVNNAFYGFMGFDECRYHRKWLNEDVDILKTTAQIISNAFESKHAEEALRESEKKYRELVENISDVIYSIDTDGLMTYISPAVESIFGYSPSEIIGKPLIEFIYKEDLPRTGQGFEETLSGHIQQNEYRILSKSGEIRWILTSSKPTSVGSHVIGIKGMLTDITDRKQAQIALLEKEQKLEQQAQRLEEVNTALNVLLQHRQEEKKKLEENILANVEKLVFPYVEKLENSRLDDKNQTYLDIISSNLKDLISPFANKLSSKYSVLTSTEIQVADLIKHGRTSKEMASLLNVSLKAVSFHRGNIRRKLGLTNKKTNLRSHLQSLSM